MQSFKFFIGYPNPLIPVQYPEPDNWQSMALELSFEDLSPEAVFNATNLVWKGAQASIMNQWLLTGLTGGVGIFEGIPLQIYLYNTNELVFDGIIDLTDPETKFSCDIVQVKIRDKKIDMINQLFGSISYTLLESLPSGTPGAITGGPLPGLGYGPSGDYVPIPYQRNDIPNTQSILQAIMICWEIKSIAEDLVDAIQLAIDSAIRGATDLAASVLDPAIFGDAVVDVVETALYTAYVIALTIAIVGLFRAAVNCLISPVLVKYGMYAQTLLTKACDYFGIGFSSTILVDDPFYSRLILMPIKGAWSVNETLGMQFETLWAGGGGVSKMMHYDDMFNLFSNGYAYGYYEGTPAQLIRALEDVFDAKAKIILDSSGNPVLHFERWDFQYNQATYSLPPISDQSPFNSHGTFNNTGLSQSAFMTNANELTSNYLINYATDTNDYNTLNYYSGTECSCTTTPTIYTGAALAGTCSTHILLKGLTEIDFEFAQTKRKEFETPLEKIMFGMYQFIVVVCDLVTLGAFSAFFPFNSSTFNLTGHMYLSADITSVPKMMVGGPGWSKIAVTPFNHQSTTVSSFQTQTYTPPAATRPPFGAAHSFKAITIDPNNNGQSSIGLPNISARTLFKNFHYSKLSSYITPPIANYASPYVPGVQGYNQWLIYKDQEIPMCQADYDLIKNNNYIQVPSMAGIPYTGITSSSGVIAKVDKLEYNPFKGTGKIDFRIMCPYTYNLSETFTVDGLNNQGPGGSIITSTGQL